MTTTSDPNEYGNEVFYTEVSSTSAVPVEVHKMVTPCQIEGNPYYYIVLGDYGYFQRRTVFQMFDNPLTENEVTICKLCDKIVELEESNEKIAKA